MSLTKAVRRVRAAFSFAFMRTQESPNPSGGRLLPAAAPAAQPSPAYFSLHA